MKENRFNIQTITFNSVGAVTALTITDASGNVVYTLGNRTQADNGGKKEQKKPEDKVSCMIPKPLYARTLNCKTVEELKITWEENKPWQENKNFRKLMNRKKKELGCE